ncbi:hypothetical protein C2G38_2199825 [Gigaspora rosea]|uniref:TLDc domain-containing protein n=1 Tax=Gigaspora rosea TaxID=44941 RepID=A0A397URA0_9GLOM|nr:hypothetical protein C2G38_2199825 [Gigaspora rosea]
MSIKNLDQLSQDFTQLLESEYNYNVVIEIGKQPNNQLFKVHSAILYQRSLYFRQKLTNSHLINNNASWLRLNFSLIYQMRLDNEKFKTLQQFCNDILVKHPIILWGKVRTPDLPSNHGEWTDKNFKSLRNTLLNCLPHVRYFEISSKDVLMKIKPYYKILEKNVWEDILAKHLDPDMSITSLILPPCKKATVQLPLCNVSIITPSSPIITIEHAAMISSWINRRSTIYDTTKIPYKFKLLLRGSKDGFTGEVFHRLYDNIPGIVVVVKINCTNEILGGYNPLIWKLGDNDREYATTADSFIFL